MALKPEVHVEIRLLGATFTFNGRVNKAGFNPPLVDTWLPLKECESASFKVGRREYAVIVERMRKPKRSK